VRVTRPAGADVSSHCPAVEIVILDKRCRNLHTVHRGPLLLCSLVGKGIGPDPSQNRGRGELANRHGRVEPPDHVIACRGVRKRRLVGDVLEEFQGVWVEAEILEPRHLYLDKLCRAQALALEESIAVRQCAISVAGRVPLGGRNDGAVVPGALDGDGVACSD